MGSKPSFVVYSLNLSNVLKPPKLLLRRGGGMSLGLVQTSAGSEIPLHTSGSKMIRCLHSLQNNGGKQAGRGREEIQLAMRLGGEFKEVYYTIFSVSVLGDLTCICLEISIMKSKIIITITVKS